VVYTGILFGGAILILFGFSKPEVALVTRVVMLGYTLWFDWFLLRHGLQISSSRAAIGVLAIMFATLILILLPMMLITPLSPELVRPDR
jgi:hypothetical protein